MTPPEARVKGAHGYRWVCVDISGNSLSVNNYTHLTLSGDLGSGKTSIARELERRLAMRFCSTGELHRQIAAELGQSALEANRTAEIDESIDRRIDGRTIELGQETTPTIFDSRMAWNLVKGALRVHLVVDSDEAARRVLGRAATAVEKYASLREASEGLKERSSVERRRFSWKYGVDILALSNYDFVIDTTNTSVEQVVDVIEHEYRYGSSDHPKLWVNPTRVRDLSGTAVPDAVRRFVEDVSIRSKPDLLNLFYVAPVFFVVTSVDAALLSSLVSSSLGTSDATLVQANLLADSIEAKERGVYLARVLGSTPSLRLQNAVGAGPTVR